MTNIPTPLDPIAQIVAKYQSNGHQTLPPISQPVLQAQQKTSWIGFGGRTLWDWLNLLGVLLVPLMIGVGTILITAQQGAISQSQHESDLRIADNQFQEALLKTFRDDMNRLVFDQHLLTAKPGDPVQIMAQSYTNDALRKLDLPRRTLLVQFLGDLSLILSTTKDSPLISLGGIHLKGANLNDTNLSGADLSFADLGRAEVISADLSGANLSGANLSGAILNSANLKGADLSGANLKGADLSFADLSRAKVIPSELAKAYTLRGAMLPDGSLYPSSSYSIPNHQEPPNHTDSGHPGYVPNVLARWTPDLPSSSQEGDRLQFVSVVITAPSVPARRVTLMEMITGSSLW